MPDAAAKPVDRWLIALPAVGCGATVANLYYAQPLLSAIDSHFGVSDGTAGLLVTVSQVGYGLGLAFLARTLSALVAGVARRRTVFALGAVAMAALAVALWRALPPRRPSTSLRCGALFGSIGALIRREAVLRRRMVFGACGGRSPGAPAAGSRSAA